jgi:hypothetical protein
MKLLTLKVIMLKIFTDQEHKWMRINFSIYQKKTIFNRSKHLRDFLN